MCYYKRNRYSCNHINFTVRLRTCQIEVEHQANPDRCAPCAVKAPHPFHTVSVRSECVRCRQVSGTMNRVKTELGFIRERVEKLEEAKALANERLAKRVQEACKENARLRAEKVRELEMAGTIAKERLERRLREAREKKFGRVEGREGKSEGPYAGETFVNVRSSW
ncbi:hypothetical protein VUR80DRAFT_6490 [Thermomyces stellatus]